MAPAPAASRRATANCRTVSRLERPRGMTCSCGPLGPAPLSAATTPSSAATSADAPSGLASSRRRPIVRNHDPSVDAVRSVPVNEHSAGAEASGIQTSTGADSTPRNLAGMTPTMRNTSPLNRSGEPIAEASPPKFRVQNPSLSKASRSPFASPASSGNERPKRGRTPSTEKYEPVTHSTRTSARSVPPAIRCDVRE